MTYSHLLHIEHEQSHIDDHGGAYTVFSTKFPYDNDVEPTGLLVQNFAVLWDRTFNPSVIKFIEHAIMASVFSPIKIIHLSKGILSIVHCWDTEDTDINKATHAWIRIAKRVSHNDWMIDTYDETEVGSGDERSEAIGSYAYIIMDCHNLGIKQGRI
jgi:hypothetical protein